jgi:branched-chain amino acid transport system substrate-binding protein
MASSSFQRARALRLPLLIAGAFFACAAAQAETGITDTEIHIGASAALSGPNASYGPITRGMEACFAYYNAEFNGIKFGDGKTRKVRVDLLDDAMEPARALQNARRFVSQMNIFAMIGAVGTGANMGARSFYNESKVPQVLLGTGGPMFGAKADVEKFPWTMGGWLAYNTEAVLYANFIKKNFPNAKIAMINDDSGGPFFADAFLKAVKDLGLNLVAHEEHTYSEPTINAKISRLANSGADVFLNITTPKYSVQAIKQMAAIGWKPAHIAWGPSTSIGGVFEPAGLEISKGIYNGQWIKDQSNPAFANDPDVKLYAEKLKKYNSMLNPADQNAGMGWYSCHAAKHMFEQMKEPTRDAFMKAARNLKNVKVPMLLEGITMTTNGAEDGYPIESVQMSQFDGKKFVPVGAITNSEGKTPLYTPPVKK